MNILLFSHVGLWPLHHAETIEIALRHAHAGDRVILWSCDGELATCPANSLHVRDECNRCVRQTTHTVRRILGSKVEDLRLRITTPSLDLPIFDSIASLARFQLEGVPLGELVVSQLVGDARDSYLEIGDVRDRALSLLTNAVSLFYTARQVIRQRNIDKVYVWNGRRCSDGPVVYAAKAEGVDYNVYISGRENTYLSVKMLKVHALEDTKSAMEGLYTHLVREKGDVYVSSEARAFFETQRFGGGKHPGYVHVAANFAHPGNAQGIPHAIPLLVFTSSYWEYFAMGDYLHEYLPYRNHYDALRQILEDTRLRDIGSIVVRWHPNLAKCGPRERQQMDQLVRDTSSYVVHVPPESNIDSYALIERARKVLTFGSTIGIEAAYYGKPSILAGRAVYEDSGAVYRPGNHEELITLLSQDIPRRNAIGAVKYGLWAWCRGNYEFVHLRRNDEGDFFRGRMPVRFRSMPNRVRSSFVSLAKALGLYEELKALRQFVHDKARVVLHYFPKIWARNRSVIRSRNE